MTQQKTPRSIVGIAGIVAAATLISKIFGFVRQLVVAAAFGLGPSADAFNYAYTIPGFLLVLLGGINGPFYSAIISVLSKQNDKKSSPFVETVTILVGGVLIIVAIIIAVFAPQFIDIFAPGLRTPEKEIVRVIAIHQLRIMSPIAVLAGLIGISFGVLNANNQFWLPSISPLFSSISVILGVGIFCLQADNQTGNPEYLVQGGIVLAISTVAGATLQFIVQVLAQIKAGILSQLSLRLDFHQPEVKNTMKIMLPATFSSGMLHINLYTDLFFASLIPVNGVAAGLANAGLLVQTPLGIISNVILVPLLPLFSQLTDIQYWQELKLRIRQGLILSAFTMLPLGALMVALSLPIVQVVYERGAFDHKDSVLVSSLLIVNGIGMFVYLGRDVLVRVFYALGDGQTPFCISMVNIGLNIIFDYIFVNTLGAPGLVLATLGVNCNSVFLLLFILNRKLNGLPIMEWSLPILGLAGASVVAGVTSFATLQLCQIFLGNHGLITLLLQLVISSSVGLCLFGIITAIMKVPEVNIFAAKLLQHFVK